MLPSETVDGKLRDLYIGPRLRQLRLARKLGLVELSAHTGLSAALLSKVERGRLIPTLQTLLRIALVYGVDLSYFFGPRPPRPVRAIARAADRRRFPEPLSRDPAYSFESLNYEVPEAACQAYVACFARPARPKPHAHDGIEMIFVMTGVLELLVGEERQTLSAGDAIYFDAAVPHAYRRGSAEACEALVFTVPRTS